MTRLLCSPLTSPPPKCCNRFIATLQDPYKQVQYKDVLRTLQEEHKLLQDMEAALLDIRNAPSSSGRTSLVRATQHHH